MHIKTVILLGNFFHLVFVMLLICQQRFLFNVFYVFLFFFINVFLTLFILGVNVVFFYIYGVIQCITLVYGSIKSRITADLV